MAPGPILVTSIDRGNQPERSGSISSPHVHMHHGDATAPQSIGQHSNMMEAFDIFHPDGDDDLRDTKYDVPFASTTYTM
jgi:hypothetical protein